MSPRDLSLNYRQDKDNNNNFAQNLSFAEYIYYHLNAPGRIRIVTPVSNPPHFANPIRYTYFATIISLDVRDSLVTEKLRSNFIQNIQP